MVEGGWGWMGVRDLVSVMLITTLVGYQPTRTQPPTYSKPRTKRPVW